MLVAGAGGGSWLARNWTRCCAPRTEM